MINIKQIMEILIFLCFLYGNHFILIDIFNIYIDDIREYKYSAPRMLNGCYRHKIIVIPLPIWVYSYHIYDNWEYAKIS